MNTLDKLTSLNKSSVVKFLEEVKKDVKKRNFSQTFEAGVNLSGISFKQPQNRIDVEVTLAKPFRRKAKVFLFSKDVNLTTTLKDVVDKVVSSDDIPNLEKKDIKKLAREYDLFFSEPSAMSLIGKHLGQILAPRGKMPKPAPMNADAVKSMINKYENSVKISNKKGKNLPTLHFAIGKENMSDEDIADNFISCYNRLIETLPAGMQNITSIYLKMTMSKPLFIYKK